ncbi:hypothetical protein OF83DRAFT_1156240 [Amylostereum chailletii]|nr:hypothetical protein OF83DRAFT_1156240 [Amylostereum chailletii]
MRDPESWLSRKQFWLNSARTRQLFDVAFHLSALVDDEIEALEESVAQVKRFRNEHKPAVSRLPPEILTAVFRTLRDQNTAENRDPDAPFWKFCNSATQVCHHWREIFMHSQILWTDIFLPRMSNTRAEHYMRRAGSAPLSVFHLTKRFQRFFYGVVPYTDAIPRDRVRTANAILLDKFWVLDSPMPLLENLELTNNGHTHFSVTCDMNAFFPRLSSLSTLNCIIPWNSPVFSHLKHLSLAFGYGESIRISVAEMNALFQLLSRINSMTLQHVRPEALPLNSPPPIHLPASLSHLQIIERGDADLLFEFIQGIAFQDSTRLTIDMRECATHTLLFRAGLNNTFTHLLGSNSPTSLSIIVPNPRDRWQFVNESTITVGARRTRWPSPPLFTSWELVPADDVRITWDTTFSVSDPGESPADEVVSPAIEIDGLGVLLGGVLDLSLELPYTESGYDPVYEELGYEIFAYASQVQRLYTSEQSFRILTEILGNNITSSSSLDFASGSPHADLFPKLDTL